MYLCSNGDEDHITSLKKFKLLINAQMGTGIYIFRFWVINHGFVF